MRILIALVALAVALASMAECRASDAPAPAPGSTLADVGAAHQQRFLRPTLAFLADGHRYAIFGVDAHGYLTARGDTQSASMLVFEDDRYLGALDDAALDDPECFAQPGGTLLLAVRLRALTAGQEDPLTRVTPDGESTFE
ncbi:MAG TPA: hypothetical protein VKE42_00375, partial [Candidatus Cybelea sp.]|nr:hypothetical protein [Candidatus Cybelea sp.]